MTTPRFLGPLLLVTVSLGCSEDPSAQSHYVASFVSGHVQYRSGTAAEGVKVVLNRGFYNGGFPDEILTWELVDATCADKNGYFRFSFSHRSDASYLVEVVDNSSTTTNRIIPVGETKGVLFDLPFEESDSLAVLCP
jgi:hypothetical protein